MDSTYTLLCQFKNYPNNSCFIIVLFKISHHSSSDEKLILWLRFIQRCFHFLGDIERYRIQNPRSVAHESCTHDWEKAQRHYERAITSNIMDGRSYHQIGILCSYRHDILRVLVWYSVRQVHHYYC